MKKEDEINNVTGTEAEEKAAEKPKKERKPMKKSTLIILICAAVLVIGLAIFGGIKIHKMMNPEKLFETAVPVETQKPEKEELQEPTTQEEEEEGPSDYELLMQSADTGMMKDIVNVLLIGVDYAEERLTWKGKKDFHADVMMVLAINFEENTVDMISIPRDTYAKIPGISGIYKINASIDCGGGFPTESGFEKVCEAAEWMLGGIPVDYYYAVTMPAVKELVDAIGGVEYDLEMDFGLAGRHYKKGKQIMDGQGVLDYLRVRKANTGQSYMKGGTGSGDSNRVNRQKEMLVAIFKSLQTRDMLTKMPDILGAFEGQLYTNTSFEQTAALALFAYNLDSENIKMHSMGGTMKNIFNWNFCITNQRKRVEIIKEVYGVDVKQNSKYAMTAATELWQEMLNEKYLETADPILKQAKAILDADKLLATPSPSPTLSPATPSPATPAPATPAPVTPAPETPAPETPAPETPAPETPAPDATEPAPAILSEENEDAVPLNNLPKTTAQAGTPGGRKYGEAEDLLYETALAAYEAAKTTITEENNEALKTAIEALANRLEIKLGKNAWKVQYESTTNEILVDFN